jgi:hypothetical protein
VNIINLHYTKKNSEKQGVNSTAFHTHFVLTPNRFQTNFVASPTKKKMKKYKITLLSGLFTLLSGSAIAQDTEHTEPSLSKNQSTISNGDPNACWKGAAQYHGVDVWLLYSIAWVESRMNPLAHGKNKNGSTDMGMMQINTIWLPELAKYGIRKEQLFDGCTSIYIGAWIMSKNFKQHGYTWKAIGAYNSGNLRIGYKYAQKVYEAHRKFTGMPTTYYGQTTNNESYAPKSTSKQ